MAQVQIQAPRIKTLIDASNQFYQDLLDYIPEQTSLQQIPENQWNEFAKQKGLNQNSTGMYLLRNQTAIIREESSLGLFHEYFGHGLYCEQSLQGRRLVDLEKRLFEEEKREFSSGKFTLEDLQKFRQQNKTFQELDNFRRQNLTQCELFAIWTEYLLSGRFNLRNEFEKKYDSLKKGDREAVDSVISFSESYGNLATFYESGLARRTTANRVRRLLEDIYGTENISKSRLILLTGSKKPFSDIDLFASSNNILSLSNDWIDLRVFDEEDFEKRIRLFDVYVTHSIMKGKLVAGDKRYLKEKKKQLEEQPITEMAIKHNLHNSYVNKKFAEQTKNTEDKIIALSYSQTYLANALALKNGKRLFTKESLELYSQSENFIELKGGIIE